MTLSRSHARNYQIINKANMQNILKVVGGAVAVIMVIDALCFTAWIVSGQHPVDGFYAGAITANIVKAIIF